jgi:hypothetical protein
MTTPFPSDWPTWPAPGARPGPLWPSAACPPPGNVPRRRRAPRRGPWTTVAVVLAVVLVSAGLVALGLYVLAFAALAFSGSMK